MNKILVFIMVLMCFSVVEAKDCVTDADFKAVDNCKIYGVAPDGGGPRVGCSAIAADGKKLADAKSNKCWYPCCKALETKGGQEDTDECSYLDASSREMNEKITLEESKKDILIRVKNK